MNALIVQCGGPTPVMNASLAGALAELMPAHGRVFGARFGLEGLLKGDWADLTATTPAQLERLTRQPGAALGGGRYAFRDGDIETSVSHLVERSVMNLLLIGGNGTMAAAHRLAQAAHSVHVVGVPKTVDNDLAGTYVAPGYGSAARYVAESVRDAGLDLRAMATFEDVVIIELMGRHAGWLAASSALARVHTGDPPHLILLPEAPVDESILLQRVRAIHAHKGICLIAAAEGACDTEGHYLAEKLGSGGTDDSGQHVLSMGAGVAAYLAALIRERLGLRCRQLRPNTLQRATSALAVAEVDRTIARLAGSAAAQAAQEGESDIMMGLTLRDGLWGTQPIPLADVVGRTITVPREMISADGMDVTAAFLDYAAPLIGQMPPAPLLWI